MDLPGRGDDSISITVGQFPYTVSWLQPGRWVIEPGGFTLFRDGDGYRVVWRPGATDRSPAYRGSDWRDVLEVGLPGA